jgi:modulator of FtsH protease
MTAYDPGHWNDFALAQLGASAALLGLVFVGLSINLREYIRTNTLVNRAAEAIIGLATVLAAATAVLIPEQSKDALGVELLVLGLGALAWAVLLERNASKPGADGRAAPPISLAIRRVFGLGAPLLLVVTAVTVLAGAGGGLYWWPAAIVAAYAGAVSNAWVLLIEVLR